MAFLRSKQMSGCVMYPWPIGNFDYVMDDALNIAMDYLDRTGHATRFKEAQSTAARAIIVARQSGVNHRINSLTWQLGQWNRTNLLRRVLSSYGTNDFSFVWSPKGDLSWCMRLQSNG